MCAVILAIGNYLKSDNILGTGAGCACSSQYISTMSQHAKVFKDN
ncbi:unnamed protein product [Urochloa humidicola]